MPQRSTYLFVTTLTSLVYSCLCSSIDPWPSVSWLSSNGDGDDGDVSPQYKMVMGTDYSSLNCRIKHYSRPALGPHQAGGNSSGIGGIGSGSDRGGDCDGGTVNPFRNFNAYVNSFIFPSWFCSYLIDGYGPDAAHYLLCYLRNLLSGMAIYYCTAGLFHYRNYVVDSGNVFGEGRRKRPSWDTIKDQIWLSQRSIFMYVALPVLSDWLIEEGYTLCYWSSSEVGGSLPYLLLTILYFCLVEIGIYWMHRTLHENKWLFRNVHGRHHAYNTPETLTPWCSIAFNPFDGILQASPYVLFLFVVPCHYLTHVVMLFGTAIWATYIHDAMDGDVEPVMSNKYHTVHHTHYVYNYGQVFIFCDWYWGTLMRPKEKTGTTGKYAFIHGKGGKDD